MARPLILGSHGQPPPLPSPGNPQAPRAQSPRSNRWICLRSVGSCGYVRFPYCVSRLARSAASRHSCCLFARRSCLSRRGRSPPEGHSRVCASVDPSCFPVSGIHRTGAPRDRRDICAYVRDAARSRADTSRQGLERRRSPRPSSYTARGERAQDRRNLSAGSPVQSPPDCPLHRALDGPTLARRLGDANAP